MSNELQTASVLNVIKSPKQSPSLFVVVGQVCYKCVYPVPWTFIYLQQGVGASVLLPRLVYLLSAAEKSTQ